MCFFFFSSPLCSSQARGFVNYYGPQRFGSGQSVQSDRVGLALLKEDLVSAADDYWQHEPGAAAVVGSCCVERQSNT